LNQTRIITFTKRLSCISRQGVCRTPDASPFLLAALFFRLLFSFTSTWGHSWVEELFVSSFDRANGLLPFRSSPLLTWLRDRDMDFFPLGSCAGRRCRNYCCYFSRRKYFFSFRILCLRSPTAPAVGCECLTCLFRLLPRCSVYFRPSPSVNFLLGSSLG